jgi:hypothetical protein
MIVIGSIAIGSSMGMTVIGLALLAVGFAIEVKVLASRLPSSPGKLRSR